MTPGFTACVLEPSRFRPATGQVRAYVDHFALRIGKRATLIPADSARAYGMLIALTHAELDRLYGGAGLQAYRPEAVWAQVIGGGTRLKLQNTLRALNFLRGYIDSIAGA